MNWRSIYETAMLHDLYDKHVVKPGTALCRSCHMFVDPITNKCRGPMNFMDVEELSAYSSEDLVAAMIGLGEGLKLGSLDLMLYDAIYTGDILATAALEFKRPASGLVVAMRCKHTMNPMNLKMLRDMVIESGDTSTMMNWVTKVSGLDKDIEAKLKGTPVAIRYKAFKQLAKKEALYGKQ